MLKLYEIGPRCPYLQHKAHFRAVDEVRPYTRVVLNGYSKSCFGLFVAVFLIVHQTKLAVDGCNPRPNGPVCMIQLQGLVVVSQGKVKLVQTEEAIFVDDKRYKTF